MGDGFSNGRYRMPPRAKEVAHDLVWDYAFHHKSLDKLAEDIQEQFEILEARIEKLKNDTNRS